ncbi:Serine--tRNA ligase, mitochondrial, partial [Stegodyphus mimosarum]
MSRKESCNLKYVLEQLLELHNHRNDIEKCQILKEKIAPQLLWFPNLTHPKVLENKSEEPFLLQKVGKKTAFTYFPTKFESLTKRLNVLRTKHLGHMSGSKSYFLKNDLSLLEQALVRFALSKLIKKGFQMVSVPDVVSQTSFEGCGMKTDGKHSQVYHIEDSWAPRLCLSGTSEIALASHFSQKTFQNSNLPLKLCAASRCYRAEANKHQKEKGIFRVHHFTKVEMFGITANDSGNESEELLEEFTELQKELYSELGLHFKILEMPPCELGLPAYHKIDMEAWIPTQKLYGEISSASNCTDYQSRRLAIKYYNPLSNETKFCHTVNGTACAIPRLLMTIFENFQNLDGSITVPAPLQKYMGKDVIKEKFSEKILSTKPIP